MLILKGMTALEEGKVNQGTKKIRKITITLFFFLLAGLCEIGGGYLVWLWLREDMSWILGAIYGGIFIVMALLWSSIFEGIVPDMYDVIGAAIACAGVAIIYYTPRRGEEKLWSNH